MFGRRSYRSRDESRNNWVVAALTFGEGWHNNHHAFPASARHGLDRLQLDIAWLTIRTLEKLGLAWNVRLAEREPACPAPARLVAASTPETLQPRRHPSTHACARGRRTSAPERRLTAAPCRPRGISV